MAKDSCLTVTMASEFLNIAVARTCGGADTRWRGHKVARTCCGAINLLLCLIFCFAFYYFLNIYVYVFCIVVVVFLCKINIPETQAAY